jgi:hypothetical protein
MRGESPCEVIQIDHMTMSTKSHKYKQVLVVVDTFSNYTMLYPCVSTGAEEAAECLVDFCSRFKIPNWLVSDSGAAFISNVMETLCSSLKLQRHVVATYHHSGNGIVERSIRWILHIFTTVLTELRIPPEEWIKVLPLVQSCINSAPRESLSGYSSLQLFCGMKPSRPLTLMARVCRPQVTNTTLENAGGAIENAVAKYVTERDQEYLQMKEAVNVKRQKKRKQNEKNNIAHALTVEMGNYVMVAAKRDRGKLEARWVGPFKVISCPSSHLVEVENLLDGKTEVVHVSRAIQFNNRLLNTEAILREQNGYLAEGFEVEAVIDHRQQGNEWEVLIKWRGFENEDNTWEPIGNIIDVDMNIVRKYVNGTRDHRLKKFFARKESQEGV